MADDLLSWLTNGDPRAMALARAKALRQPVPDDNADRYTARPVEDLPSVPRNTLGPEQVADRQGAFLGGLAKWLLPIEDAKRSAAWWQQVAAAKPGETVERAFSPGEVAMGAQNLMQPLSFLYHVTPSMNDAAIAREGLRPDAPKIAEGGPHGSTRAVFLGDESAADTYRALYGDETTTYRVRRNALRDLAEDPHSEGQAWLTPHAVPPQSLERLRGDQWEALVALLAAQKP